MKDDKEIVKWRTTKGGHKVGINSKGIIVKGHPEVVGKNVADLKEDLAPETTSEMLGRMEESKVLPRTNNPYLDLATIYDNASTAMSRIAIRMKELKKANSDAYDKQEHNEALRRSSEYQSLHSDMMKRSKE